MRLLKLQSPTSVTYLLQQGLTSQSFPKSSASWVSVFKIYEPVEAIHIQRPVSKVMSVKNQPGEYADYLSHIVGQYI